MWAAIVNAEGINIYRQSANQIFASLGVVSMNNKPIHKILSDWASLSLKQVDWNLEDVSAFETESYELTINIKFIPNTTAQDPNFINIFLDIILAIVTHFKSVSRGNINELMKIIDARPVNGYYIFTLG